MAGVSMDSVRVLRLNSLRMASFIHVTWVHGVHHDAD